MALTDTFHWQQAKGHNCRDPAPRRNRDFDTSFASPRSLMAIAKWSSRTRERSNGCSYRLSDDDWQSTEHPNSVTTRTTGSDERSEVSTPHLRTLEDEPTSGRRTSLAPFTPRDESIISTGSCARLSLSPRLDPRLDLNYRSDLRSRGEQVLADIASDRRDRHYRSKCPATIDTTLKSTYPSPPSAPWPAPNYFPSPKQLYSPVPFPPAVSPAAICSPDVVSRSCSPYRLKDELAPIPLSKQQPQPSNAQRYTQPYVYGGDAPGRMQQFARNIPSARLGAHRPLRSVSSPKRYCTASRKYGAPDAVDGFVPCGCNAHRCISTHACLEARQRVIGPCAEIDVSEVALNFDFLEG